MKWVLFLVSALIVVAGCDQDKDQYSGLSELVAERQEVRRAISKDTSRKKRESEIKKNETEALSGTAGRAKKEAVSTSVLYEKSIKITDSQSGITLARGVAYMNKKGQIVRIKVIDNN